MFDNTGFSSDGKNKVKEEKKIEFLDTCRHCNNLINGKVQRQENNGLSTSLEISYGEC